MATGPVITTYYMRAFDSGTIGWVYWTATDPTATPLASTTTPNYTGTLGSYIIVLVASIVQNITNQTVLGGGKLLLTAGWRPLWGRFFGPFSPAVRTSDVLMVGSGSTLPRF